MNAGLGCLIQGPMSKAGGSERLAGPASFLQVLSSLSTALTLGSPNTRSRTLQSPRPKAVVNWGPSDTFSSPLTPLPCLFPALPGSNWGICTYISNGCKTPQVLWEPSGELLVFISEWIWRPWK